MTFAEHLLPQHSQEVQRLTQNPKAQNLAEATLGKVEWIIPGNFPSITSIISPKEARAILEKAANDHRASQALAA